MKIKFWQVFILILICAGTWMMWKKKKDETANKEVVKIISPHRGNIRTVISTTGTVLPKNRLQVKPPVNGRIEEVLVKEGQQVKAGDILVWMSSTDRAALMDAARGRGAEVLKEWQDVYKAIPLISPINGEVIVGTIQPGQAVTTADDVVVLSDRLIVRAQADETDIGRIQNGQNAIVSLDAYPAVEIDAVVDHIYYESQTVNNVTIYDVDLLIEQIPPFFRSGMNANIDFVTESKKEVLLLPLTVVQKDKDGASVMINAPNGQKPVRRTVETGMSDDKNIEIISGVTEKDEVIMTVKKYSPAQSKSGTSPFMPARRR